MLTKAYDIDGSGRWERRYPDFAEDIVVICGTCETPQDGRVDEDGLFFVFLRDAR